MLSDINNGITLCKKLGFIPNKILIGNKEFKEMQSWTYSGASDLFKDRKNILQQVFNVKFLQTNKNSQLIFSCNKLFKF